MDAELNPNAAGLPVATPISPSTDGQGVPQPKPAPACSEFNPNEALVAGALARRALCPDCVRLGGCPLGIPGLMPLPEKGQVEPVTGKTRPYLVKLIQGTDEGLAVVAFHVRSRSDATRGQTYISGASYCAAVRRGQIKRVNGE